MSEYKVDTAFIVDENNRLVPNPNYRQHGTKIVSNTNGSPVEHPNHYNNGSFEVIDVVKDWLTDDEFLGFIKGNVIKYVAREKHKNGLEDLKKARFYLDWYIKKQEESR